MGSENRSVTAIPFYETANPAATPPTRGYELAADWNYWQDSGTRALSLDGTMTAPGVGFEDIEGAIKFFCITPFHAAGTYQDLPILGNPHRPLFETYYPFERLIDITIWGTDDPDDLPKGATYDPDIVEPLTRVRHLWYTAGGAADGHPPVGDYWKPWAASDIYIYANTGGAVADQTLRMANRTLVGYYFVLVGTITQGIS